MKKSIQTIRIIFIDYIMKTHLLIFLIIAFCAFANAQSKNIEIGLVTTIHSKILNEDRAVWVYNPGKESANLDAGKKYPVVYLLDGDWHFSSVVGILQQLSFINGNTICPEMIVVGIPIPDRYRDLTPTCDSTNSRTSGGNAKFISFLKNELIPYIDSSLPVAPYKMLIGHSLGGLTVMNILVNEARLFNSYVSIDPSMWWDNQFSLKETEKSLSRTQFENTNLFLAIANTMESGMDTAKVKKDVSRNTLPIRSILKLSDQLNSNAGNKLNYKVKFYQEENHGLVPLIATYDAFRFIFNFYNLPLTKKDYTDSGMSLAYKLEEHYEKVSEKMGYKINPSESTVNSLGYNSLIMNNFELAEYFFKLNVTNYPNNYNVYDSYGDYYLAVDNQEQAILQFMKALSIYENPVTRKKLESIQKK